MRKILPLVLLLMLACSHKSTTETPTEAQKMHKIIADYTEQTKHLDPFYAPYLNVEEDLPKFGDYLSPEFLKRQQEIEKNALERIKSINSSALSGDDLTTYKLFYSQVDLNVRGFQFPLEDLSFNQMQNRFSDYIDLANPGLTSFPFDSLKHYQDFIQRSEGFTKFVDNQIQVLNKGIHEHVTLNCVAASKARNSYADGLKMPVEKNPFWEPVEHLPDSIPALEAAALRVSFREMITKRIVPGFKKFDVYYREKYLPHCAKSFGIRALPQGEAWYEYDIESSTTLKLKAQDLHELGLQQVAMLTEKEKEVQQELGNHQSLSQFRQKIANSPDSYYRSSEDLFKAFIEVKNRVTEVVPQFFSLIPHSEYDIVPTTNPESAAGQYNDPTEMRPRGKFIVNTLNLKAVPKYEVTTLSLHETVPGHHFQLALAYEMRDKLSEFRRKFYSANAFVEGWAHYAEYLGLEMGMYKDPMQRFGYLDDQMLRAVRLVVDTGIHYYNWDQKKAVKYMLANIASDKKSVEIEASRYSVWPGQALGYKVGQLKILELRQWAEQKLGNKFDIKGFHRAVIGNGTVSLPVLEDQVHEWAQSVLLAH